MTSPNMIGWLYVMIVALLVGNEVQARTPGSGSHCWTPWFDRDNPSGTGDYETLKNLYNENPNKICKAPLDIEVQTTSGLSMDSTGDVVAVADTTSGFICRNSDQNTGMCSDYRVRFRCPLDYCQQKDCWTPWFDRDNPSGTGDYETLKNLYNENPNKICKAPLDIEVQTTSGLSMDSTGDVVAVADTTSGFICRNSDQNTGMCSDYRVRFRCPLDYCQQKDCWTPWFDRDNPSGTGDYETLKNLYNENRNKICQSPLDIEVQTTSGLSMDSTGDVVAVADTKSGFICRNSDQNTGMCSDYRVRFRCPLDYCQRKG
ncbi:cartilage intermediate layer protein 1-like isoform X2 [Entelurus aequoreus]|uniref:cartilage intermediate layer protein 1-like isoform X2 n=1 Tax=Entelurus aequoreus TaxID=161455 RepID=UPI002B1D414A|nr:cartilage intermediate layer protein 1-like isoform X2 [Entelurus aequoreus]XP_061923857.1 cartilage intermediate layer protein 1-like isoform X2 [Entelurus aequoreus]